MLSIQPEKMKHSSIINKMNNIRTNTAITTQFYKNIKRISFPA